MKISIEEVEKIAHLARLRFSKNELTEMQGDLDNILSWMNKLNELDTTGVAPQIYMTEEVNEMRDDKMKNSLSHEEALDNAPKKDSNYIRVPKTIE